MPRRDLTLQVREEQPARAVVARQEGDAPVAERARPVEEDDRGGADPVGRERSHGRGPP
jgi:hypothetical protein